MHLPLCMHVHEAPLTIPITTTCEETGVNASGAAGRLLEKCGAFHRGFPQCVTVSTGKPSLAGESPARVVQSKRPAACHLPIAKSCNLVGKCFLAACQP